MSDLEFEAMVQEEIRKLRGSADMGAPPAMQSQPPPPRSFSAPPPTSTAPSVNWGDMLSQPSGASSSSALSYPQAYGAPPPPQQQPGAPSTSPVRPSLERYRYYMRGSSMAGIVSEAAPSAPAAQWSPQGLYPGRVYPGPPPPGPGAPAPSHGRSLSQGRGSSVAEEYVPGVGHRTFSLGKSSLPLPGDGGARGVGAQPTYRMGGTASGAAYPEHAQEPARQHYQQHQQHQQHQQQQQQQQFLPPQPAPHSHSQKLSYAAELTAQMEAKEARKRAAKEEETAYERAKLAEVPPLPGQGSYGIASRPSIRLLANQQQQQQQYQQQQRQQYQQPQQQQQQPQQQEIVSGVGAQPYDTSALSASARFYQPPAHHHQQQQQQQPTSSWGALGGQPYPPGAPSSPTRTMAANLDAEAVRAAVARGDAFTRYRHKTPEELSRLAAKHKVAMEQAGELERQILERAQAKGARAAEEKAREMAEEERLLRERAELARREGLDPAKAEAPVGGGGG